MNKERNEKIIDLRLGGNTYQQICDEFKISAARVRTICLRKFKKIKTNLTLEKAVRLADEYGGYFCEQHGGTNRWRVNECGVVVCDTDEEDFILETNDFDQKYLYLELH